MSDLINNLDSSKKLFLYFFPMCMGKIIYYVNTIKQISELRTLILIYSFVIIVL